MASNDLVLLDQELAERKGRRTTTLPDDEAFELFAFEQLLRDRDLSDDELIEGQVGGGGDGGIDGLFIFVEDGLLVDDSPIFDDSFQPAVHPRGARIEAWFIQAKQTSSFSETAIDKLASSLSNLLDLSKTDDDLRELYSAALIERGHLSFAVPGSYWPTATHGCTSTWRMPLVGIRKISIRKYWSRQERSKAAC